jgi:hypothetical protein
MKNKIALVKRICRICYKAEDAEILLASEYTPQGEPTIDMDKYHKQIVGFLEDSLCKECKEKYKPEENYIIVGVEDETPLNTDNPPLTGTVVMIKKDSDYGRANLAEVFDTPIKYMIQSNIDEVFGNIHDNPELLKGEMK